MQEWFNEQGSARVDEEDRLAITRMMVYKMAQLTLDNEPIQDCGDAFSKAYAHVKSRLEGLKVPTNESELKARFKRLDFGNCAEHVMQALAFAKERGIHQSLMDKLDYLNGYAGERSAGCILSKDFAPYSFGFCILDANSKPWFHGGLIFHGQGDSGVGAPTLSVRIGELDESWSIHT
jgi:hypothetical protein